MIPPIRSRDAVGEAADQLRDPTRYPAWHSSGVTAVVVNGPEDEAETRDPGVPTVVVAMLPDRITIKQRRML